MSKDILFWVLVFLMGLLSITAGYVGCHPELYTPEEKTPQIYLRPEEMKVWSFEEKKGIDI